MELKHKYFENSDNDRILLIVPYGIETQLRLCVLWNPVFF